jgi:hypothetical protein
MSKENKVPKTIKVSTLLIASVVVAGMLATFALGWAERGADQARVQSEAVAIVTQLKSGK